MLSGITAIGAENEHHYHYISHHAAANGQWDLSSGGCSAGIPVEPSSNSVSGGVNVASPVAQDALTKPGLGTEFSACKQWHA